MRYVFSRIKKAVFIALSIVVICALPSCAEDRPENGTGEAAPVDVKVALSVSSDLADAESYVSCLRVIAIDRSTGVILSNKLYAEQDLTAGYFTIAAKRTALRLYFIANESAAMGEAFDGAVFEEDIVGKDACNQAWYDPEFVPGTASPMLMSGKLDVVIPSSWNIGAPFPVNDPVKLARVPAKITFSLTKDFDNVVTISGASYKSVVRVLEARVVRVPSVHSVLSAGEVYSGAFYAGDTYLTTDSGGEYVTNDRWTDKYVTFYVPEHILKENNPDFATAIAVEMEHYMANVDNAADINGIRTRKTFYIPVKTESQGCNILRNNHYKVDCRLTGWTDDIYTAAEVLPWEKKVVDVEFDKPEYDWVKYVETVDPESGNPVISAESPLVQYGFRLKGPKAAYWKATVTNGRYFRFAGSDAGVTDPDNYVTVSVGAVFPWEDTPVHERSTDLIIFINEKEVIRIKNITQIG